jgi:hypothetical protein
MKKEEGGNLNNWLNMYKQVKMWLRKKYAIYDMQKKGAGTSGKKRKKCLYAHISLQRGMHVLSKPYTY